jgi:hypothetical protein
LKKSLSSGIGFKNENNTFESSNIKNIITAINNIIQGVLFLCGFVF